MNGRLGDATITDVTDDAIFYEYFVGGLTYHGFTRHLAIARADSSRSASPDRAPGIAEIFVAESGELDSVVRGLVRAAPWAGQSASGIVS